MRVYAQTPEIVPPQRLMHPQRFDLIAKYIYAQHYQKNTRSSWPKELYREHIRAFNNFHESNPPAHYLGGFIEQGKPKHCFADFLTSYNNTLDSLKQGYDLDKTPIPVAIRNDFILMNGAHRAASCMAYGHQVPITRLPLRVRPDYYPYSFFMQRGLKKLYADEMARSYSELEKNIAVIALANTTKKDLPAIARKIIGGTIYYAREITINALLQKNIESLLPEVKLGDHATLKPGTSLVLVVEFCTETSPEHRQNMLNNLSSSYTLYAHLSPDKRCQLANMLLHEHTRDYFSQTTIDRDAHDSWYNRIIRDIQAKNIAAQDICITQIQKSKNSGLSYIMHHRLYPIDFPEDTAQAIDSMIVDPRKHRYYRTIKIAYQPT